MPRAKPTPARKASGENIENWQRHTVQVLLRLPPDVAARLRAQAVREGLSLSGYVARCAVVGVEWWASHAELFEVGSMLAELLTWSEEDVLRFVEKPWKWGDERGRWIALGRPDAATIEDDSTILGVDS